jgi:hypothetical protein
VKSDCDPILTNKDAEKTHSYKGTPLIETDTANPCGLVALSFFNDEYELIGPNGKIDVDSTNIAWETDKDKFKLSEESEKKQWIDVTDQHFMVWMRTAGMPNFRKLWGQIDGVTLENKQNYTIKIANNYNSSAFGGTKYIVLSTTNAFGGKNEFLAICYLVVGSLCIIFAIFFFIAHLKKASAKRRTE